MSVDTNLLSLPEEVLCYIGKFLEVPGLLALSTTCQSLRSALNSNSVWQKYSHGGALSQALKGVTSVVEPIFTDTEYQTGTLEPLCEHRLHLLRQTRLVNNYSKGKFVQCSVPFEDFLFNFETVYCNVFSDRQITYKDQYLFVLGYAADNSLHEEVKVFDIKEMPCLLATFKLLKHEDDLNIYSVLMFLKVIGNKLVVRQDTWFDVYEIKLPDTNFCLLHSINVRSSYLDDELLFLERDFIIVENHSDSNSVRMWNVCTGERLDDIKPKIEGSDFKICNYPGSIQDILLSVEVSVEGGSFITPHLFVYSLHTLQYTDFYVILPFKTVPTVPSVYFGLIGSEHVVLFHDRQKRVEVFVYDIKLSALLVRKSLKLVNKFDSCIVNGCLVLSKRSNLVIFNLSNLETVWKIEFKAGIKGHESFLHKRYIESLNLHPFLVVRTSTSVEVWNLENRKKCFDVPGRISFLVLSDFCSKIIGFDGGNLETWSFW